jgi:hypothetical protein
MRIGTLQKASCVIRGAKVRGDGTVWARGGREYGGKRAVGRGGREQK